MAAVNMDAGVCAAVGGQVLMLIKWERVPVCVRFTEPSVCTSSKCQRGSIPVCVCVTSYFYLYPTLYVCVLAEYQQANERDYISMLH